MNEIECHNQHDMADLRCPCGSLIARVVDGAVEIKCRRCKRVWRVPIGSQESGNKDSWMTG